MLVWQALPPTAICTAADQCEARHEEKEGKEVKIKEEVFQMILRDKAGDS